MAPFNRDFEEVYRRYFKDVYLFALRLAQDEHLAEEVTSETFFRALSHIDDFRGDCDLRVWLCQIAKNCYFSHMQKTRRVQGIDGLEDVLADRAPGAEERIVEQADAMRVHELLHELPEPYKEVFTLRVFGELSFRQIASLFHKSENWACVTFYRAKTKIQARMEERHE